MSASGRETRASTRSMRTAQRTGRGLLAKIATKIMGSIDAFFDDSVTPWSPALSHSLAAQAIQAAGSRENLTAALELIKPGRLEDLASALGITVDGQGAAAKRASIDARYAELLASTVPSSAASAATSPGAGPPTGPGFVTPAPPSGHAALRCSPTGRVTHRECPDVCVRRLVARESGRSHTRLVDTRSLCQCGSPAAPEASQEHSKGATGELCPFSRRSFIYPHSGSRSRAGYRSG
jgi:hypothetical protein